MQSSVLQRRRIANQLSRAIFFPQHYNWLVRKTLKVGTTKGSVALLSTLTWTTFHRSPLRSIHEPRLGTVLSPSMSRSISSVVGSPLYRNTICLAALALSSLIETSTGIVRLEIAIHKSRTFLSGCILSSIFAVAVQHRLRLDCFLRCFSVRFDLSTSTASNFLPNRFVDRHSAGVALRPRYSRSIPGS